MEQEQTVLLVGKAGKLERCARLLKRAGFLVVSATPRQLKSVLTALRVDLAVVAGEDKLLEQVTARLRRRGIDVVWAVPEDRHDLGWRAFRSGACGVIPRGVNAAACRMLLEMAVAGARRRRALEVKVFELRAEQERRLIAQELLRGAKVMLVDRFGPSGAEVAARTVDAAAGLC